jgi:hypothetical protein
MFASTFLGTSASVTSAERNHPGLPLEAGITRARAQRSGGSPPRIDDVRGRAALHTLGIGLGNFVSRQTRGRLHMHRYKRLLFTPGRPDDVHPNLGALEFERCSAPEAFQSGVDQAYGGGARHGLLRQTATAERDGSPRQNMLSADPDNVDLSHEFVVKRFLEIGVCECRKGFEYRVSRRAHDCIDLTDCAESCFDRSLKRSS